MFISDSTQQLRESTQNSNTLLISYNFLYDPFMFSRKKSAENVSWTIKHRIRVCAPWQRPCLLRPSYTIAFKDCWTRLITKRYDTRMFSITEIIFLVSCVCMWDWYMERFHCRGLVQSEMSLKCEDLCWMLVLVEKVDGNWGIVFV